MSEEPEEEGALAPDAEALQSLLEFEIPYWVGTNLEDEHRRWAIFVRMAEPDIDARILVENMQYIYEWLKAGVVPAPKSERNKVKL